MKFFEASKPNSQVFTGGSASEITVSLESRPAHLAYRIPGIGAGIEIYDLQSLGRFPRHQWAKCVRSIEK